MTQAKRNRGRPPGTGLDDSRTLQAMAELMASEPRLKPTTAIKRLIASPNHAEIRRLQSKWKSKGPCLLAQALEGRREREEARRRQQSEVFWRRVRSQQEAAADFLSAATIGRYSTAATARDLHDSAAMRTARDLYDSPTMRAARDLYDSPAMRAARGMYDSAAMRMARDLYDSPTMRAARDLFDSPLMRAAREIQDSPVMRAAKGLPPR